MIELGYLSADQSKLGDRVFERSPPSAVVASRAVAIKHCVPPCDRPGKDAIERDNLLMRSLPGQPSDVR